MDITTRQKLIHQARLIFYGLPIGNNSYNDAPILGNKSLAQVVINRIESITKKPDEFKYMVDCVMQMLKETKGQEVKKIKMLQNSRSMVSSGLTDHNGFVIPSSKVIKSSKALDEVKKIKNN